MIQLNGSVAERVGREFTELCARYGIVKQKALEAAAYWFVHKMKRDEFMELMDEVARYASEESEESQEASEVAQGVEALKKLRKQRPGQQRRKAEAG